MVCQDDQLCAGLKAGIYGAIHGVQSLLDKNSSTEEWGFLLVDAKNAFNEIQWVRMLSTVRHLWPSGARSVFNWYRHWSFLFLRNSNGTVIILHSKKVVNQGGSSLNDRIRDRNTSTYQEYQMGDTWRHTALVCWQCRSLRYVCKTWDLFIFAYTPGHETGVSPQSNQELNYRTPG